MSTRSGWLEPGSPIWAIGIVAGILLIAWLAHLVLVDPPWGSWLSAHYPSRGVDSLVARLLPTLDPDEPARDPTRPLGKYVVWYTGDGSEYVSCDFIGASGRLRSHSGWLPPKVDDLTSLVLIVGTVEQRKSYLLTATTPGPLNLGTESKSSSVVESSYRLNAWVIDLKTSNPMGFETFPPPVLKNVYSKDDPMQHMDFRAFDQWIDSLKK